MFEGVQHIISSLLNLMNDAENILKEITKLKVMEKNKIINKIFKI